MVGVGAGGPHGGEVERIARLVVRDVLKRQPPKEGAGPGNPWPARGRRGPRAEPLAAPFVRAVARAVD